MLRALAAESPAARQLGGYDHALREILQQPATWRDTETRARTLEPWFRSAVQSVKSVVLTGSGSSEYAGACVAPSIARAFGKPALVVPAGAFLTEGAAVLAGLTPCLVISFARSGDSPESVAVLDLLRAREPASPHLAVTCNQDGALARWLEREPGGKALVLDPRTCDRSLVMTSSFTNMALAMLVLANACVVEELIREAEAAFEGSARLQDFAPRQFHRAIFLGSGSNFGAAREAALKMLEMTSGRVVSMAETFLGLRHGPMSAIDPHTAVVCLHSADPVTRAFENDVVAELEAKGLNGHILRLEGETLVHVVRGQILGFFRCLHEGLRPDAPSAGVIHRVVGRFTIHQRP